jgi:hypothetical protein
LAINERGNYEEVIDEALAGRGEVTSGRSGNYNIDIEIFDDNDNVAIQGMKML